MRKFSKIFAVVLTLCVLFSAMATAVFAENATAKKDLTYKADGVSNISKIDFEEDANGSTAYASSASKSADSVYGWAPVRCGTIQATTVIQQIGLDGVTTNNYLRMRRLADGGDLTQSAPYWEYYAGKYQTPTHKASEYSYIIADYDFGCDEYEYVIDGKTYYGDSVPEEAEYYELNYPSTCNSYMILRGYPDAAKTTYLQTYIVKDKETGLYYMSADSSFQMEKDGDFLLQNKAGAWDHISMVLEVNNAKPADSMLRYYVNGKLFTSQVANKSGMEDLAIDSVRFNVSSGVVTSGEHYTFCIDNLAVNYYALDYTSGDDVYGIDDYYSEPNHESINLSVCRDIVYNENYTYFGTQNPFTASLVHADESVENFYSMDSALEAIKDGDYITLEKSLKNFVPDLQNIKELTFVTNGEATFNLDSNYLEYYKIQQTDNIYTIKYAGDDAMKLVWNDSEGEGRLPIKVQNLLPLFAPNEGADELLIYGKVDKSDLSAPTIEIFDHWEWDMDNDGIGDGKRLTSLTVLDINELREKGIDTIYAVPKFNVMPLAYEISLSGADGKYFNPTKDYSLLTSLEGLGIITKLLGAGDVADIIIHANGGLNGAYVTVPAGATVNFDINGNAIEDSSDKIFLVNEGATLNLDSSKKGAYIYNSGKSIITINNVNFADINIGTKETKKNFTLYGSSIVDIIGNQNISNGGCINVNLCGGTYISTASRATMFSLNDFDLNYEVFSATIYSANGSAFATTARNYSAYVNVESSTILANKFIDSTRNYSASITNSVISGFIPTTLVELGEYNIIALADTIKADQSNLSIVDEVYPAQSNNGVFIHEQTIANPVGDDFEASYEIGLLTFVPDPANSALHAKEFSEPVSVTWLDTEGDVYFVSYWLPGSVIGADLPLTFPEKDFNNGWFKAKYTKWNNITDSAESLQDRVVYKDSDNVLKPVYDDYFEALEISVSLQVSANFGYNVYLPAIPEYDGFEFHIDGTNGTGFYINGKLVTSVSTNASVNGVEGLLRLTQTLPAESFESEIIEIRFIANNKLITKKISVNVLDYAITIASEYEHGSKENMIVYAMMQYKINAYLESKNIANPTEDDLYNEIYDSYFKLHYQCACSDINYEAGEEKVDYTAIEKDVIKFAYSAVVDATDETYASKFLFSIFVKKDSALADPCAVIKDEILGDATLEFDKTEYADYVEYSALVDVEYVNKVITISSGEGEAYIEATYSLAKYIEENNIDIYKAIYVISSAAYQTKVSELEIGE